MTKMQVLMLCTGCCRLAAAVTREPETGVPLQHLSEMVSVQGFDSDRWVAAQPKDNEVCAWGARCSLLCEEPHAGGLGTHEMHIVHMAG